MELFLSAALVLLPLVYLLVALNYGLLFFQRHAIAERLASPALRGALALHLAHLIALTVKWQQFPAATVPQALSLIAFAVALVYALVEWQSRERSTGLWMIALVFLLQLLASLLQRPEPPSLDLFKSPLFTIHVFLALIGYAAFVLAAVYGFLYLELYRELKSARFRLFYGRLPPLEVLDRMLSGALAVGFAALTGAVGAGLYWTYAIGYEDWLQDTKIVFTLATWLLYGLALGMRRLRRWRGPQTAVASLAGLAVILLSLVVINFVFTGTFHAS